MPACVLIADAVQQRGAERARQLALDGWETRYVRDPDQARQLLPGADALLLGQFAGSAALAPQLIRDVRAGAVDGVDPRLRIVATAGGEPEAISTLNAGADLIIAPGASLTLVSATVAAALRREDRRPPDSVRVGALEVRPESQEVRFAGQPVRLSGRERDVLFLLAGQPGRVFNREEIAREVWGAAHMKTSRALDTHVNRMAAKFRASGGHDVVRNVWGRGYKLNENPQMQGAER